MNFAGQNLQYGNLSKQTFSVFPVSSKCDIIFVLINSDMPYNFTREILANFGLLFLSFFVAQASRVVILPAILSKIFTYAKTKIFSLNSVHARTELAYFKVGLL